MNEQYIESKVNGMKDSITPETNVGISLGQFWSLLIAIVGSTVWLTWSIQAGLNSIQAQEKRIDRIEEVAWTVNDMGDLYSSVDLWLNNTNKVRAERRGIVHEIHNSNAN